MATNYIQNGSTVSVTAPAATTAGEGVLVGSLFGVAQETVANAAAVEIMTTGVHRLAKTSAQAWTVGARIYWDDSNTVATTTASSNKLIGVAVAAAANPSSTGDVLLTAAFTI